MADLFSRLYLFYMVVRCVRDNVWQCLEDKRERRLMRHETGV